MRNQTIMVAVDFGTTSARAMTAAIELAQRMYAPLDIVHVCPRVPFEAEENEVAPDYLDDANRELAILRFRAQAAGVQAETYLRQESIVFGLLAAIEELQPKIVVVGSHGRTGFPRVLLGSVSESVARRCGVPVLIVPSHERERQAAKQAWSCHGCGHILSAGESSLVCGQCGMSPAHWDSAPIVHGPIDANEPAVGLAVDADLSYIATQDPGAPFATAPAGTSQNTNAELHIRRF